MTVWESKCLHPIGCSAGRRGLGRPGSPLVLLQSFSWARRYLLVMVLVCEGILLPWISKPHLVESRVWQECTSFLHGNSIIEKVVIRGVRVNSSGFDGVSILYIGRQYFTCAA